MASNFAALSPIDSDFLAFKDPNLLKPQFKQGLFTKWSIFIFCNCKYSKDDASSYLDDCMDDPESSEFCYKWTRTGECTTEDVKTKCKKTCGLCESGKNSFII